LSCGSAEEEINTLGAHKIIKNIVANLLFCNKGYKLELFVLKQAWTQMSNISRHMPLTYILIYA
jgi:hypothetical protein